MKHLNIQMQTAIAEPTTGFGQPKAQWVLGIVWFAICACAGSWLLTVSFGAYPKAAAIGMPAFVLLWVIVFFLGRRLIGLLLDLVLDDVGRPDAAQLVEDASIPSNKREVSSYVLYPARPRPSRFAVEVMKLESGFSRERQHVWTRFEPVSKSDWGWQNVASNRLFKTGRKYGVVCGSDFRNDFVLLKRQAKKKTAARALADLQVHFHSCSR